MSTYTVKTGQNIYDVALNLYGSIEGVFDLLISNDISLDDTLVSGQELAYHDSFVINQDVINSLDDADIVVKNGNTKVQETDIQSVIEAWINTTNANVVSSYKDYLKTKDNNAEEVVLMLEEIGSSTWGSNPIELSNEAKIYFCDLIGDSSTSDNDVVWAYKNGLINATGAFINADISIPKLLVKQSGISSTLKAQIPTGEFIMFDWGDGSDLDFYGYTENTSYIQHSYNDSGSHKILMYGTTNFVNLDISAIGGMYYALAPFFITNNFITLYKNATTLNTLFIKKNT